MSWKLSGIQSSIKKAIESVDAVTESDRECLSRDDSELLQKYLDEARLQLRQALGHVLTAEPVDEY